MNRELRKLELEELRARVRRLEAELAATPTHPESLNLQEMERRTVQAALVQASGNKMHAAKALGISRRALYRLIDKYHLEQTTMQKASLNDNLLDYELAPDERGPP